MEELFILACSIYFHIPIPRGSTTHNELGPSYQSLIYKRHYRLIYRQIWKRHFLSLECLFPNDASVCQIDQKYSVWHSFGTAKDSRESTKKNNSFAICRHAVRMRTRHSVGSLAAKVFLVKMLMFRKSFFQYYKNKTCKAIFVTKSKVDFFLL